MVKKGKTWYFDTKEGKEELINRRIGRNELNAIEILREYAVAQREYIRKDWDATVFISMPPSLRAHLASGTVCTGRQRKGQRRVRSVLW